MSLKEPMVEKTIETSVGEGQVEKGMGLRNLVQI